MNWPVNFGLTIVPEQDVLVCGDKLAAVKMQGRVRLIRREIMCPAVKAYGTPEPAGIKRDIVVESFDLGETSIVHEGAKISVLLDFLSSTSLPSHNSASGNVSASTK